MADLIADKGKFQEIADTMIGWELDNWHLYELPDILEKTSLLNDMVQERIHKITQEGYVRLSSKQCAAFGRAARKLVKLPF
jgi:hypothetical protein